MKILFCKCFGIGNAVMAVPAIKALKMAGHEIDVLVGSTDDDVGAAEVMLALRSFWSSSFVKLHIDSVPLSRVYDIAVLSIPFDGRWTNGVHFNAKEIIDGRTRPDPCTSGLISWKKHEIEYQMENAHKLDYQGDIPTTRFDYSPFREGKQFRVYLGVGYKKDIAGFWKQKHWGNQNFATLATMLRSAGYDVITTGDQKDIVMTIAPIIRMSGDALRLVPSFDLYTAFRTVRQSHTYVGNDTGMMHVAASFMIPTLGLFFMENSITKSRPWGPSGHVIDGVGREVSPEEVFEKVIDLT